MFFKDLKLKPYIILSTYILVLAALLMNFGEVLNSLSYIYSMLSPFIWAIAVAFVLNLLMKLYENKILIFLDKIPGNGFKKSKRPIAIVLALLTIIAAFTVIIMFVIPQLIDSVSKLGNSIPTYMLQLEEFIEKTLKHVNSAQLNKILGNVMNMWKEILGVSTQFLTSLLSNAISITVNITTTILDISLSLIFAIYMLANKEKLITQTKKVLYAFIPRKYADKTLEVAHLANKTYSSFISGQCLEALIMGSLCFIGMSILRLPYAFLIGTLVGTTCIIPIFGAFMGIIPSVLIIFMVSPIKAVYFLIFILILQQIEGNFIYPRVVGNSVGLSSIWIMVAILIGTSVYGIIGVFIGIPLFAVIYKVFAKITHKRLAKKDIKID